MNQRKNMKKFFCRRNIMSVVILVFIFFIGFYAVNALTIKKTSAVINPLINKNSNSSEVKLYDAVSKNTDNRTLEPDNTSKTEIKEKKKIVSTYLDDNEKLIVKNTDDILVLVNKKRNLPPDYVPQDLVIPQVPFPFKEDLPKKQLRKVAATALEELFAAAETENINLYAVSGYRSYQRQQAIYNNKVRKDGEEMAKKYVAYPGQSEHQTGLAMDVTAPNVSFGLAEAFASSQEGQWLAQNCYKYGFIIRYPKGKEDITGYSYESWHIRYVGADGAKEIFDKNITLEEYLEDPEKNESPQSLENKK